MKRRSITITDETWMKVKLAAVKANKTPSQIVEEACQLIVSADEWRLVGLKSTGEAK